MNRTPPEPTPGAELRELHPGLAELRAQSHGRASAAELSHLLSLADEAVARLSAAEASRGAETTVNSHDIGTADRTKAPVIRLSPKHITSRRARQPRGSLTWSVAAASLLVLAFVIWPERVEVIAYASAEKASAGRTPSAGEDPAKGKTHPAANSAADRAETSQLSGAEEAAEPTPVPARRQIWRASAAVAIVGSAPRKTNDRPGNNRQAQTPIGSGTTVLAKAEPRPYAYDLADLAFVGLEPPADTENLLDLEDGVDLAESAILAYYYSPAELAVLAWATGDEDLEWMAAAVDDVALPW